MKIFHISLDTILSVLVFLATANQMLAISDQRNECIDNWTATSTTNAPAGRSSHTAVWTGIAWAKGVVLI